MTPTKNDTSEAETKNVVWLILRKQKSHFQAEALRKLQQWASERQDVELRVRHAEERRQTRDGDGRRPIDVMNPVDAYELYQGIHRARSCVMSRGSIYILKDPRRDPPTQRDCIPLSEYVCHKAAFDVLVDERDPIKSAERMLSQSPSDCSELRDPRIIPLHVFDGAVRSSELLTSDGREKFRRAYQIRGGHLTSPSAGMWAQADAHARHGGEALHVGDYTLPAGFHWDVSSGRKSAVVVNSKHAWKVDRDGYVNTYPDAYIRAGSNSRQVWSAKR